MTSVGYQRLPHTLEEGDHYQRREVTNAGYNTAAVVLGHGGKVTNSGTISTTGVLDSAIYTLNGGIVTNSGKLLVSATAAPA